MAAPATAEPASVVPRRNESKAQEKKRKKEEEKAIAKIKASKAFQKRYAEADLEDEDEAARHIFNQNHAPLPGQMENCAVCEKRFTVTAYSRSGPLGGLLCPVCTKEANRDEGPAKKKRKMATKPNRRNVASRQLDGTYHTGSKNLITLCIETLAKNVDMAEDLGDLPDKIVEKLAAILSNRRLMTPSTLDLFIKPGSDRVLIYDGAKLSSDDYIKIFQVTPTVKHLHVENGVQFKNRVMDYLISSPTVLESFRIHGANLIDDERWNSFLTAKGSALQSLKLYFTDGHFGDDQLELLTVTCPHLNRLKVVHNQKVTDSGIYHLVKLEKLQHLSLDIYNPTSSEPYVEVINSIGGNLRSLSLDSIDFLNDSVLEAIHENCTQLKKLRLSRSEVFTDEGFINLFAGWANSPLHFVDLNKCRHVDATNPRDNPDNVGLCSAGFEALMAHSGTELRYLNLCSCRHISADSMEKVFSPTKIYPELVELDASFIWGMNDFVVGRIFRSCPKLKTLKTFGNIEVKDVKVPRGRILVGVPNALGMQIEGDDDSGVEI